MVDLFDVDNYRNGEWRTATDPNKSSYERLGFKSGDAPSVKEIEEAFNKRHKWWIDWDKKLRGGWQGHPLAKEIGPLIPAALRNLSEAKYTLGDPIKKAAYDNELKANISKEAEKEFLRFVRFSLRDKELSQEEKTNLLNEADTLEIARARAWELIVAEMRVVGACEVGPRRSDDSVDAILQETHYELLGVPEGASLDEITAAYKRLVQHWKMRSSRDGAIAGAKLLLLDKVWSELSDRKRRAQYDEKLRIKRENTANFSTVLDFRSGETAKSLLEAAHLIDKYWEEGKRKLASGDLAGWLGRNGNSVLADDIRAIEQTESDKDVALDKVIQAFKVGMAPPSVDIKPSRIAFGRLESGQIVTKTVTVSNSGRRGYLYGEMNIPTNRDGLSLSRSTIGLLPGQYHDVEVRIDTTNLAVKHTYDIKIVLSANTVKPASFSVSFHVAYPISKTLERIVGYALAGGVIGGAIRGCVGYPDWLRNHLVSGSLVVPSMSDVDINRGNLHFGDTVSFVIAVLVVAVGAIVSAPLSRRFLRKKP